MSATLYRENWWRRMRNILLLHSPVFPFFLPPFLILLLQLLPQFYYHHIHFIVVGSDGDKFIKPAIGVVICLWVYLLMNRLSNISIYSFFFPPPFIRIIDTHCFKTNDKTTKRQNDTETLWPIAAAASFEPLLSFQSSVRNAGFYFR